MSTTSQSFRARAAAYWRRSRAGIGLAAIGALVAALLPLASPASAAPVSDSAAPMGGRAASSVAAHGERSLFAPTRRCETDEGDYPSRVDQVNVDTVGTSAFLTWGRPGWSAASLSGYAIQMKQGLWGSWRTVVSSTRSTTRSYTIRNLYAGEVYYFRVAGVNSCGVGRYSWAERASVAKGVPSAPTDVSVDVVRQGLEVSWSRPVSDGGYRLSSYWVQVSTNGGSSWGTAIVVDAWERSTVYRLVTLGRAYVVRVGATNRAGRTYSEPTREVIMCRAPGSPTDVTGTSGDGSVDLQWLAPENDGGAVTGYEIEVSDDGGDSWRSVIRDTESDRTSATVDGLDNGQDYVFRVSTINDAGVSDPSDASEVITPLGPPGQPERVRAGVRTVSSAEVRWLAPSSGGARITAYIISVSRDDQQSWTEHEVNGSVSRFDVPELAGAARAAWIRIAAVNRAGQGDWSEPFLLTSSGAKPVRVSIVDSHGDPVIGGAITWAMKDGSAESSRTYGLSAAGDIDFPAVPAGFVNVTITDAVTVDYVNVSGEFNAVLGFSDAVLTLPEVPSASHAVRVTLPNGLPVPGVELITGSSLVQYTDDDCREWAFDTLGPNDYCLDYGPASFTGRPTTKVTVDGFVFEVLGSQGDRFTDADGVATLRGFTKGQPEVTVMYDDGIIRQRKKVVLRDELTSIELDYMPWLDVAPDVLRADFGAAVQIPIRIQNTTRAAARSAADGILARTAFSPVRGIKVTVIPPAGAPKGSCRRTTTAQTDAQGRATLKVCATASGIYRFSAEGAAAVDEVLIKVSGTAPMAVESLTARSLRPTRAGGLAKVTWATPQYDGGSTIQSYVVTATAKGKRTVTTSVPGSQRTVTLSGLANATAYTISVTARTTKGSSDPVTVTVPVA